MVRYTLEQRLFMYDVYIRKKSFKKCRNKFRRKFPGVTVPNQSTIYNLVKKVRETGSFLNRKPRVQNRVLTEQKLDDIGYRLEQSPRKSLRKLAQQVGVSKSSCWNATKLLKLKPYRTTVVHRILQVDHAPRLRFSNWLLNSVADGFLDPQLTFFSDEAWFHLSGYVNGQNSRHWCSENPHLVHEVPLHDLKVGVWCAMSAERIIGPIIFYETVDSDRYITEILTPFFVNLTDQEIRHGYFQQDGATAHTAKNSMKELEKIFQHRIISRDLWPARSPDLNPCDFYLWGNLKGKVFATNPHTLEELENNIGDVINSISKEELQLVFQNLLKRCEACIREQGGHFQHIL